MIYHPPSPFKNYPTTVQTIVPNLSFFLSSFRALFLFLQKKKKKNTFRADFTGTTDFTIPDDLYTPLEGWRRRRRKEEVRKRAKWKIRGDYRGSGALAFGLVTQLALDAWVVYPRDVERGGSNPFVRASTTRVQTLSLDLEIVTRERVDQECHGEEARDNCPGKDYLNSGPRTSRIYQGSFPCSRNPDDKLPGNRQIVIRWNVLKKLQGRLWNISPFRTILLNNSSLSRERRIDMLQSWENPFRRRGCNRGFRNYEITRGEETSEEPSSKSERSKSLDPIPSLYGPRVWGPYHLPD